MKTKLLHLDRLFKAWQHSNDEWNEAAYRLSHGGEEDKGVLGTVACEKRSENIEHEFDHVLRDLLDMSHSILEPLTTDKEKKDGE